jgi:hypothetical protein
MPVAPARRAEYLRHWQAANPEKMREYTRKYLEANHEDLKRRQRERRRENPKSDSYYRNRAKGFCAYCKEPPAPGRVKCAAHLERDRLRAAAERGSQCAQTKQLMSSKRKEKRAGKIASGVCLNCAEPAIPDHQMCEIHRQAMNNNRSKWEYGLSDEELVTLQLATTCALCGKQFSGIGLEPGAPVIDHCHFSGKVRGVIRQRCNLALGMFRDDSELLEAAISYLRGTTK